MKFVSREQFIHALRALADFRAAANKQGAQHILPFLALKRKKVNAKKSTLYGEADDFDFFNTYARVENETYPYFDPIASQYRISTHPHSNIATARKGTFFRAWNAGKLETAAGKETWQFNTDYVDILGQKALTKSGKKIKVPAAALAAFLFRKRQLPDGISEAKLGLMLKDEFNLTDEEFSQLFETGQNLGVFSDEAMTDAMIISAIQESGVLLQEKPKLPTELSIQDADPMLLKVRLLIEDGYAGVIFVGPPGTSKSWYALQIALALTEGDTSRVRKIQFHKSYQYEHFVEGFVPNQEGTGFELKEQMMLRTIKDAQANPTARFIILIDELSRSDPGRVFGELLTYIEPTRRDEVFFLASGREIMVPSNIIFLATMNSRDKSVQEIDDAFDRRMAKIEFPPDATILEKMLKDNGVADDLSRKIQSFLKWVNTKYPLGHAFFKSVKNEDGLARLWETQLKFVFDKQFKYEPLALEEIRTKFAEITGIKV